MTIDLILDIDCLLSHGRKIHDLCREIDIVRWHFPAATLDLLDRWKESGRRI